PSLLQWTPAGAACYGRRRRAPCRRSVGCCQAGREAAMPVSRVITIVAVAGLVAGLVPPAGAQREQDHDQLPAPAPAIKEAVNAKRLDDLLPLLAKNFSITMVDQTLVTQPGQIKEYFRRYFEAPDAVLKSVRIEPEADILTEFLDEMTGVNHGTSTDTY